MSPIIIVLAVVVVACIAGLGFALLRPRDQSVDVEKRLKQLVATPDTETKESGDPAGTELAQSGAALAATAVVTDRIDRVLTKRNTSYVGNLQKSLAQADIRMTSGEFVLVKAATTVVGYGIGFVLLAGAVGGAVVLAAVGTAALGFFAPDIFIKRKANKRVKQFNDLLGDTLTLMANSLRSGYSLLQTMDLVSREGLPPVTDEFKRVLREIQLGLSIREAFAHLLVRVPSEDLDLLITAINIQAEVGGNLAQILDTIGHTIRERIRIKGEIKVLVAQGQISGYVISGLPIALAAVLMLISPGYLGKMFAWPWLCMPICGLVLIVAGFFAIKKIVDIEV